ncbi:hypothetical protein [Nisaea nitritireducens]|uniref:hypothetical protein n=1 Tax=Nisaea nitritireducens TaxID=568392 RepID=UPI001865B1F6|nr:hypothetical protein [Nisaea nitritireducens]|tara:strand:+ start:3051 stop:3491 length:441 start_codon:yes stop_codon:yes gene_type:complete
MGDETLNKSADLPAPKSVEELRQHLFAKHNAAVDHDDPVLLLYSILRVGLDEQDQYQRAYTGMITEAFDAGAKTIVDRLQESVPQLSEEIASKIIAANIGAVEHTGVIMDRTLSAHRRLLRWTVVLIFVGAISAATSLYVLFSILS